MVDLVFILFFITQINCDDNLPCTGDAIEDGGCHNRLLDGYCLIGNVCYNTYDTSEDGCGVCLPARDPYIWSNNTNDDLVCTADSKDNFGNCIHTLMKGFCLIGHRCIVDGMEDINGCRSCDASRDPYHWIPSPAGKVCNDGEICTKNDRCDGEGECRGERYSCDDGILCTDDLCDGNGGCNNRVKNNYCLVEGQCIEDLNLKDGDECKYCNVLVDRSNWTSVANGTPCDDNDPDTPFDYCNGRGECRGYRIDPFADTSTGDLGVYSEDISEDISTDILGNGLDIEREGCSCTAVY